MGSFVYFPIYVIDSTVYKSVAYMWRVLPHHATLLPQMVFRVPPPRHFLVDYILFAPFLSFRRPPAAQVLERALFQPRNITAADVQRLRRLLLGLGRTVKSIPLPHNSAFPGRQSVHQRAQPGGVGAALDRKSVV